ncbi:hypothetical protein Tco_0608528 [Tanacetum coccineum]
MAQRFLPPSAGANTVCCAALITRSQGTLLGGLHDDSQSEVFYYAIFISSKTGLGGCEAYFLAPVGVVTRIIGHWVAVRLPRVDPSHSPDLTSAFFGVRGDSDGQIKQNMLAALRSPSLVCVLTISSRIPLVKVRWNSKRGPEFT